jgi:hypothetical protein
MKIDDFKEFVDKTITMRMNDGETAIVRVILVSEEYEDIIVDVLETTRPDRYRDRSSAYTFAIADVVSADISRDLLSGSATKEPL